MSGADIFSTLLTVLRVLAPLFLLILLGALLRRRGVIPAAAVPTLNGIVINVTLPALIVLALVKAPRLPAAYITATLTLLFAEMVVLGCAAALGALLRLPRPTRGALMMTAAFGNTGFLGYPIALARPLLADLFPLVVLQDQFGMQFPMYIAAAFVGGACGGPSQQHPGTRRDAPGAARRSRRHALLRLLRSPLFLAVLTGLAIRVIPWPKALLELPASATIGGIVAQTLTYLGQGTTPVVLLALGAALRPGAIRRDPLPVFLSCALKLVALPLIAWGIGRALGIHDPGQMSSTIEQAAMPTAVVCSVLCTQYAMEGDLAVGIVFTSTVFSAVTVPLALALLR